jgi:ABC-type Fe3+/spermidine/putrescine transport system ATPase subunit
MSPKVTAIDDAALRKTARALVAKTKAVTAASPNETNLRHEIENALEAACGSLGITWTPYTLDKSMAGEAGRRFVDVAHGAVIIEYEPPHSLSAPANLRHAQQQADEYATILSKDEGRALGDYILITWDGALVSG